MNESEFYYILGQNISSLRNKKGVKQEDLANHLGLSRPSVVNIEKGNQKPSIFSIIQIAFFLNVDIMELIPITKREKLNDYNFISLDFDKLNLTNNKKFIDFFESL